LRSQHLAVTQAKIADASVHLALDVLETSVRGDNSTPAGL
jgi:hypothetical protein